MSRRKIAKENIRKIQCSKGSYYITIPVEIIREFKWKERQKVIVAKNGKMVVIKDWK